MSIHLQGLEPGMLGAATLLVGDPGRIPLVTDHWTDVRTVTENREFVVCTGQYRDLPVSVCSTGIGLGSTEIAVLELLENDARAFVRVGGCGGWQDDIAAGTLLLNQAMLRDPGMLAAYVPDTYPAAADPELHQALHTAARRAGKSVRHGIGFTAGTYYLGQGRPAPAAGGPAVADLIARWRRCGILNCDMETAVIYVLASLYGVPAANCLVCHINRGEGEFVPPEAYREMHREAAGIVLAGLYDYCNS